MELLFLVISLVVIAALVLKVLWISVGWANFAATRNAEAEFIRLMEQLDAAMLYAQQHPCGGNEVQLPPGFAAQLMRAQTQFAAMDRIAQQRHETFVSGMLSDASAAGVDVNNWAGGRNQ